MAKKFYPIVVVGLSDEDGGGFAAYVPDLHGCMSDGDTPDEAVEHVADAIEEWCAEMDRLGREIPEPGSAAKEKRDEWASLINLIEEQDEALKVQDEIIDRLQREVGEIKSRVRHIMEIEGKAVEAFSSVWGNHTYAQSGVIRTFVAARDRDQVN